VLRALLLTNLRSATALLSPAVVLIGAGAAQLPALAGEEPGAPKPGTPAAAPAWDHRLMDARSSHETLWCAVLPPGAEKFTPNVVLCPGVRQECVQLAVRPSGTLDAVWWLKAKSQLVHAFSTDGAKTFSEPTPAKTHAVYVTAMEFTD
jgi:hypothetical protein